MDGYIGIIEVMIKIDDSCDKHAYSIVVFVVLYYYGYMTYGNVCKPLGSANSVS